MTLSSNRSKISLSKHAEEQLLVQKIIDDPVLSDSQCKHVAERARDLVAECRVDLRGQSLLDSFLQEFGLSNQEGVALMCLAEALLRVPDSLTADRLIAEKVVSGDWKNHFGNSESLFVNSAAWGLFLTGKIVQLDSSITEQPEHWLRSLTSKLSEPIVRAAVRQAMRFMGKQYVLGQTIDSGIRHSESYGDSASHFSFDMLGEAARTIEDADRYFQSYKSAIESIGLNNKKTNIYQANSISVKLSALHPKYDFAHYDTVIAHVLPRVTELCLLAKQYNIGLSIDAEEAARLELSLDIFEKLSRNPELDEWNGLGFVLQAYQKRAIEVTDWLINLAREHNRYFLVRLVKGAYWDTEIKHSQEQGLEDYPVFTRKQNTDVCYLACAKRLLNAGDLVYPQFATHNAHTALTVIEIARSCNNTFFEFQRLHGMGELMYAHLLKGFVDFPIPLRVYAPIGQHEDLLPYLVRRLLENGANSSFVNNFLDKKTPVEQVVSDLYPEDSATVSLRHEHIPTPINLFLAANESRLNAQGVDLDCKLQTRDLESEINRIAKKSLVANSIVNGVETSGQQYEIMNPAWQNMPVGMTSFADAETIESAIASASRAFEKWRTTSVTSRADILYKVADLLESNSYELIAIISREAGRTIPDCVSEVREAVDFCRYYALQAIDKQSSNEGLLARGVFLCISPWNFPLAIFVGQVAAALAVGNCVIAKPAEQTPIIASMAVQLFLEAGCPPDVLHLILGNGAEVGQQLIPDPRISGVAFTGSNQTALTINRQIANREGNTIPFIAETGGQNCMIVDSTALPEQVVDDVIASAFYSAGQRCSALRVLYLQDVIADKVINMLAGAMQSVVVGDPSKLSTEIGPVIDQSARALLEEHVAYIEPHAIAKHFVPMKASLSRLGFFFQPRAYEIDSINVLNKEVFGPILHIIRYNNRDLDKVIADINDTGFGLTLGIHSRIQAFADTIFKKTNIGNTYINRNMVGAVVGVNPFGGKGLSGTGPKAGGPNYLYRFLETLTNSKAYLDQSLEQMQIDNQDWLDEKFSAEKSLEWSTKSSKDRYSALQLSKLMETGSNDNYVRIINFVTQKMRETVYLPGPTGEENCLLLEPRGVVALVVEPGLQMHQLLEMMLLTLSSGNSLVLMATTKKERETCLKLRHFFSKNIPICIYEFTGFNQQTVLEAIDSMYVKVVLVNQANALKEEWRVALSKLEGEIIPVVEFDGGLSNHQRLLGLLSYMINERTKTDNLVARGGNTQLFNLEE